MAWNRRGYYRRSHRVNGQVVTEYVGAGARGKRAAQMDAAARDCAAIRQAAERIERAEQAARDAPLKEFDELVDQLVHAALLADGYYRHDRGEWRKRHGHPKSPGGSHVRAQSTDDPAAAGQVGR